MRSAPDGRPVRSRLAPPSLRITEVRKKLFVFLIESFFLVLTTGKFFNKVNQAESLDLSLALAGSSDVGGGERNP